MTAGDDSQDRELARRVLRTEAAAIEGLIDRLDAQFDRAVDLIAACGGRVIVTGMGKSGIIARKLAATMTSTGTPAYFLHPAEAIHGDLGVIQASDIVVALSHSGETAEVVRLLEAMRRLGIKLVAITGVPGSTLGEAADATLDCRVDEEACPLNLAPTASTTAALAMGDALSMAVSVRKGFSLEDFAILHPGGKLGKRLMRAEQLMHAGKACPIVRTTTPMRDVIYEMTSKGLGMTCVIDDGGRLVGIVTDGDLRRRMGDGSNVLDQVAGDVMTPSPKTIAPNILASEALRVLEERRITSLIVRDANHVPLGVIHIHDLWRTELF
jgi:arabinose-5-phosphate isomerase